MKDASLYIHIPFCKQACHYCDFHFSTVRSTEENVITAMLNELRQAAPTWGAKKMKSLYFGGGTPSILAPSVLEGLIQEATTLFQWHENVEITLEANPDDITPARLNQWFAMGINRLSIGLQSFNDNELKVMNRAHNAAHSLQCLQWINESAFTNFTVDLMYGMPGSTVESWQQQLDTLATFKPPHLSCYALTVEEKTTLHAKVQKGDIVLPSDEIMVDQFTAVRHWAANQGFVHYELSNFAQTGMHSRHNSHYWSGSPYLGIGPGAHSFDGEKRFWNISNNTLYTKGAAPTSEELTATDIMNERLMVRLRTAAGFRWKDDLLHPLSTAQRDELDKAISAQTRLGNLCITDQGFHIPPDRWMESDAIIANLFL
jgi:oxygen-independent coproporphyrinogen-3 oxidase